MSNHPDTPLGKALDNIDDCARQLDLQRAALRKHKRWINSTVAKLAGCDSVNVSAFSYGSGVSINATMTQLDGFKGRRLTSMLEQFTGADKVRNTDYPENLNRTFVFEWRTPQEDGSNDVRIVVIDAYARSDSPTCRKVEVGRKRRVVVEKEYRIDCQ